MVLSDFESLFIQAEAAQRGWITGSPQALYESAVTQNFEYLNPNKGAASTHAGDLVFDDSDAAVYLRGGGFPGFTTNIAPKYTTWDSTSNPLQLILTQKWAALNGINWVEAWTDYRRTGFPTSDILGISHAPSHIQNVIPVRYLYPQSELNTNSANVPSLTTANLFNSPPFWAQ